MGVLYLALFAAVGALQRGSALLFDHDQLRVGVVASRDAVAANAAFAGELDAIDEDHMGKE